MLKIRVAFLLSISFSALFISVASVAAEYKPAIELASLMDLQFYEKGALSANGLQIVFPPTGKKSLSMVIVNEQNKIVSSKQLRIEKWSKFPMFDGVRGKGAPFIDLNKPGKYKIVIILENKLITSMAFVLKVKESEDPFNPEKHYYREGLWSKLGYLSKSTKREDAPLHFNFWTSVREVPEKAKCTLHLLLDGKEVATSRSSVFVSSLNWDSFRLPLMRPGRERWPLTMSDLTSQDGDYHMVMKANGKVVKSFTLHVKSGAVVRPKFNRLGFEPHSAFVSPRRVDTSAHSGSKHKMLETFWVIREK